jgi:hypothetical protein
LAAGCRQPNHGRIRNDPPTLREQCKRQPHRHPGNRARDEYQRPILKPWAAAQIQKTNDEILRGEHPDSVHGTVACWPGGTPAQSLYPFEPVYFIQTPKEVWMIWQRDHVVRRVFLTDKHSSKVKPSWFGESIGHYENGDTLVIDTIGVGGGHNRFIDNFPYSAYGQNACGRALHRSSGRKGHDRDRDRRGSGRLQRAHHHETGMVQGEFPDAGNRLPGE